MDSGGRFVLQLVMLTCVGWLPAYLPWSHKISGSEKFFAYIGSILLVVAVAILPVMDLLRSGGDQSGNSIAFWVFVGLPTLAFLAVGLISGLIRGAV